jgi:hypothetical protein
MIKKSNILVNAPFKKLLLKCITYRTVIINDTNDIIILKIVNDILTVCDNLGININENTKIYYQNYFS